MKYLVVAFLLIPALVQAQNVQSGPMLGYNQMREVAIWIQLDAEATVEASYWLKDSRVPSMTSEPIQANRENAFTATLICDRLEPGMTYGYTFMIDGKQLELNDSWEFTTQPLWQFRTDPPEFSIAAGSCAYINEDAYDRPGDPYGGDYQIFDNIATKNPQLMIWLGDNTYLREADWASKSGVLHRYTHTRSCPEMQTLLKSCHHYAILDDHDFGPNDSNGSWIYKDFTREAFEMFWANPTYGAPEVDGLITQFSYADIDFFMLDNRTFRTDHNIKGVKETILGKEQKKWLIQALERSQAPFKMVAIGGQFISDAAVYENYSQYEDERKELIDLITRNNIRGVIFLSGDRHSAELSVLELDNGNMIYDLTSSPLTSTAYDHGDEPNTFRVDGTMYGERNFATISFSGPRMDRKAYIQLFDSNGKQVWDYAITQANLSSKKKK